MSRRIVRRDENNKVYDPTQRFLNQVADFPYCSKKDLVDAASRIYDMDVRTPVLYEQSSLEPEVV